MRINFTIKGKKEKGKEKKSYLQKTKLRKEKVDGVQKAWRGKTQSNNGEKKKRKSKEGKERLSDLKS